MTISDIITKNILPQLDDIAADNWFADTLLPYVVEAVYEVVRQKPSAYPVMADLSLAAGAVQDIGTTYVSWISAVCNITGTSTPDKEIAEISKEQMDKRHPGWMTDTGNATAKFVMREEADPRVFYIYPQRLVSPGKIRMIVSQVPAIASTSTTFPLDEVYLPAVVDWTLARAIMDDRTVQDGKERAKLYMEKFYKDLAGAK